jgi:hypothetical protein
MYFIDWIRISYFANCRLPFVAAPLGDAYAEVSLGFAFAKAAKAFRRATDEPRKSVIKIAQYNLSFMFVRASA